jgi:antitoxin component of MazEF toxin-antitoxin module
MRAPCARKSFAVSRPIPEVNVGLPNLKNVYTMAIRRINSYETIMSGQSVLKWGNSLAFRIPSAIAKQMDLSEGEHVEFHFDGAKLIIEKAEEVTPFTHRDLVAALKRAKRQRLGDVDFGAPRGKEIL